MDNKVIKNHITLKVVEQLGILYKEKEKPYSLVTILGELILYKDSIIIIICSCLTSDAVPIKVHADYCRGIDTKNLQGERER